MENNLKPCPFCGKEANYEEEQDVISCMNTEGGCGFFYNGEGYKKKDLIKAWNTRKHQSGKVEDKIKYKCPACNFTTLFIDSIGHIVCGNLECKEPLAFDKKVGTRVNEEG